MLPSFSRDEQHTEQTVGYGSDDGIDGFGEPNYPSTRLFTIFYSAVGIVAVLGRIGSLLSIIQESTNASLNAKADEDEERFQSQVAQADDTKKKYGTQQAFATEAVEEPIPAWQHYCRQGAVYGTALLAWLLASSAIFCALSPGLTYVDSIYFSWITAATIGFSEKEITTRAARVYCAFFILMSTAILTFISGGVTAENAARVWSQHRYRIQQQSRGDSSLLGAELLHRLQACAKVDPQTGARSHDELSFLIGMLDHMALVPRLDSKLLLQYFAHLDEDHSGSISMDELWAEHHRVNMQQKAKREDKTLFSKLERKIEETIASREQPPTTPNA